MLRSFSSALERLSPLDGRYARTISPLTSYLSESGLIKYRIKVEISWFLHLASKGVLTTSQGIRVSLSPSDISKLNSLWQNFSLSDAEWVKQKEQETNHDLKAVEYFIKHRTHLPELKEYIHVCCTSEDINNLSYSLMFTDAMKDVIVPSLKELNTLLIRNAKKTADISMLSRTHGQPASPTTVGKEIANFSYRLSRRLNSLEGLKLLGKCNGAVGNYNAHVITFPDSDWLELSKSFVNSLGLDWNPYTTQIEPHDSVADLCAGVSNVNTILLDLCRDMWGYISLGYFKGAVKEKEVGSSTMPHKVNPIDFENAEGNLGIANSLLVHLQHKLPVSRFQRDLSDSTALRNVGSGLGCSYLAYKSIMRGFDRVSVNNEVVAQDLNSHWEVLAEPVQMILRKYGYDQPYELLKKLTRGLGYMKQEDYEQLILNIKQEYDLPSEIYEQLKALTPFNYVGLAKELAEKVEEF
jgi:adenylosuccinate lyase